MTGRRPAPPRPASSGGFTLVEVAVVLLVLGVLARATLAPLGERLEERRRVATRQRLDSVQQALIGHLATQGVLPCPLSTTASAPRSSDPDGGEDSPCTLAHGLLPAAALGVAGPIDAGGALLDAWGRPLHYAVSLASDERTGRANAPYWTTPGELSRVGLGGLEADIVLCRVARTGECPRDLRRADAIAFVVLSSGASVEPGEAEHENVDGDRSYVVAPPSAVAGHRFDDQLVWASRDELAYWLLRAGWLP